MVVYLDVLIMENLIVNLFLLYVTAQTLRIKPKLLNMILSSSIGSIYVITLLYPKLKVFSYLPFKVVVAGIMILIVFRRLKFMVFCKALSIFVLYSMVLAGACIFIEYSGFNNNYFAIINFSYKKLMISIMIIYMLIHRIIIYIKDRKELKCFTYNIDIVLKNSKKTVEAFLDTGNELREPATNLPVIIVEKSIFKDVDLNVYDKFYIPYRVVSGKSGNLEGFKPECIKIYGSKEELVRQVIVAFCEEKLSDFNEYHALLSRGVI
ncbi:sigma-E processing peptidase SpoIIGA [Clostridium sp. P21]|uniref:Sigma-E processing peptidase SpoIIGA n=1 Tax=Clostridium muellerianum TaxID=2716538 RepID=A0A7Y0EM18_9CLOT|nr:sigma-E processing peptidase SpoIIGA [Clostridium muellerianum]NMM65607.1 sigma-E processing peptidase SpoIIGA [Clostridium muellerianum]